MRRINHRRGRLVATIGFLFAALLIGIFFATGSLRNLNSIKELISQISIYVGGHRSFAEVIFFIVYLLVATLALPVTLFLTLLGGALFGVATGSFLSWLACSIGATFSFLVARHVMGDYLIEKLKQQLHLAQQSWADDGLFYLFTLRLIPGFPFILANFLMALLPIRALAFFLVTLAGTLPLTIVYTNAGYRLGELRSLEGILQPHLIVSLVAVGVTPLILKKLLNLYRRERLSTSA